MITRPNETNKDAHDQVEAFLEILKNRLELDEEKLKRIAEASQKNGKTYVTWAWIIGILLGLVALLGGRQLSSIDSRLEKLEIRQSDVRERLRVLEERRP